jgi:hypothetical protein
MGFLMRRFLTRVVFAAAGAAALVVTASGLRAQMQPWNNSGLAQGQTPPPAATAAPAPRRDLTGTWDAGGAGIAGPGHVAPPFTPEGQKLAAALKPGNGPRIVHVSQINDPLSTLGDPAGFPRNLLFELRPVQIVHTPNSVLMLYMFEKRWRTIWTDGRALPTDPDPRWYGYSVGRWVDDTTFVVDSVGMDERTWLDNAGNPHSAGLRVEERYHRVSGNVLELTVTINDPAVYTKPWTPRNRLPLRLLPPDTDLMEMIPSASEAAAAAAIYRTSGEAPRR